MNQIQSRLHPRRPLFWLLLAAALAVTAWGFWPRAVPVESATIARGPLVVSFNEEARTRLRDRYLVSAPLAGAIERIELHPGDAVSAGQTVAVLRPSSAALLDRSRRTEAVARIRAAEHALTAATASLDAASADRTRVRAELQRAESLATERLVARAELDVARARSATADAALRAAGAQRDAAQVELDAAKALLELQGAAGGDAKVVLVAPITGKVLRRLVESEGPVAAGQALLEIGDPAAIEVVSEVLTADAVRIGPGTPVRLSRWGGEGELAGTVRVVEPGGFTKVSALGVEEQRVLVVVDLDAAASARARLGDGFRLEAQFLLWQSPSALSVPTAALFHDGEAWAVYVIQDGRARLRRVQLGPMGEEAAAVRSGLAAGEVVVLYPDETIREGSRVRALAAGQKKK